MGVTLTCDTDRVCSSCTRAWRQFALSHGSMLPGLTMAAREWQKVQRTGRCNPLWEEWGMGLWRRRRVRI